MHQITLTVSQNVPMNNIIQTRMWDNAQRDGRPAKHSGALCSTPQSLDDALLDCRALQ